MRSWFVYLLLSQLCVLICVGLIRFWYLAQMSSAQVAGASYGLFLFCSSVPSIFVPFIVSRFIDQGRYRRVSLCGSLALGVTAIVLMVLQPWVGLVPMACLFTFAASMVVVSSQLCIKSAVVQSADSSKGYAKGNLLNQVVLALSLFLPALIHLQANQFYSIDALMGGLLLCNVVTAAVLYHRIPQRLVSATAARLTQVTPRQAWRILLNYLMSPVSAIYVWLLLSMNFLSGSIESYALPQIQQLYGGDGLVYALLAVGCIYFIGSFVSVAMRRLPAHLAGPKAMFVVLAVGCTAGILPPGGGLF
ncbi:MAG: hypothetical protein HRT35_36465, partial [Algicola sp.]|nr:hypothetical protein [Algicola sp.]